jgi:hypothetical protein
MQEKLEKVNVEMEWNFTQILINIDSFLVQISQLGWKVCSL